MVERTDEREAAEDRDADLGSDVDADVDVDLGDADGLDGDVGGADGFDGLDGDVGGADGFDGLDGEFGGSGAGVDVEDGIGVDGTDTAAPGAGDGKRDGGRLAGVRGRLGSAAGRLGNPLSGVFSVRSFALSLVLVVGAMVAAGAFVPVPFSGLLGVFLVAFALGLVGSRSRYLELGVASAGAAGVSLLAQRFFFALVGEYGTEIAAMGAGAGLVVALLGHYFGRDVRDGLTREV